MFWSLRLSGPLVGPLPGGGRGASLNILVGKRLTRGWAAAALAAAALAAAALAALHTLSPSQTRSGPSIACLDPSLIGWMLRVSGSVASDRSMHRALLWTASEVS